MFDTLFPGFITAPKDAHKQFSAAVDLATLHRSQNYAIEAIAAAEMKTTKAGFLIFPHFGRLALGLEIKILFHLCQHDGISC